MAYNNIESALVIISSSQGSHKNGATPNKKLLRFFSLSGVALCIRDIYKMGKLSKLSRNKRTEARKNKRARQPEKTRANKIRKLLKHLIKHPEDKQAQNAAK